VIYFALRQAYTSTVENEQYDASVRSSASKAEFRRCPMRTIINWLFVPVFLTGIFMTNADAQQVYYVQSIKAKIMSAASFKSNLVAEVGRGYKLNGLGKEGSWIKVKYGSLEGYVPNLLVAANPPLQKQSIIRGESSALQQNVRRRASTYTSAAAARGLTADDRRRLSKQEKVDYDSLEQIEGIIVSDAELQKFSEGGRP
jgi:hypothetical protein